MKHLQYCRVPDKIYDGVGVPRARRFGKKICVSGKPALMAGKTVIAIAHRLSTIAAMDRLVIMDEGRIVEEGSHAELLRSGGIYSSLWRRQSGGFLAKEAAE